MDERRTAARIRSLLRGRIVFNHGQASMDCLIRNYTPDGARLAVSETIALPDEFDLYIAQRNETRQARIRWRRADEIGVSLKPLASAGPDDLASATLLNRLVAVEAENAELRRQLAEARAALAAAARSTAAA